MSIELLDGAGGETLQDIAPPNYLLTPVAVDDTANRGVLSTIVFQNRVLTR
jgi:hypothetical protein